MLKPLISFIVPVYNVEKYLDQCVNSILEIQSNVYEIILIDDGSTDESGKRCDAWSEKYSNIKVLHKVNGGLSSARNAGIQYASGEYVLFVDSDDYINSKAVEMMLKRIQKDSRTEVFFLKAVKVYQDGEQEELEGGLDRELIYNTSRDEVLTYLAGRKKYPGSACTKLVKRSLIENNEIYFWEGKTSEDLEWCIRLFLATEQYDYIDVVYYFYRQEREGSITNVYSEYKFSCLIEVIEKACELVANQGEAIKAAVYSFMAYEYVIALLYLYYIRNKIEKKQFKRYIHFFEEYEFLMPYRSDIKMGVLQVIKHVGGINMMVRFIGGYDRIRRWGR